MPKKSNPNIKLQNENSEYTYENLEEFDKCLEDEIYCIENYFKIEHPTKGVLPFELYDFQKTAIKLMQDNRYVILLFPRQCGKCLTLSTAIESLEIKTQFKSNINNRIMEKINRFLLCLLKKVMKW